MRRTSQLFLNLDLKNSLAKNLLKGLNVINNILSTTTFNFLLYSIKFPVIFNGSDPSLFNFSTYMEHSNKISRMMLRKESVNQQTIFKGGTSSMYFLKEDIITFYYSFLFKKGSPLNKVVNRKIGQLLQGGIIQKAEEERFEASKRAAKYKDEDNPEILTMDHLGLCFIAIMICLGLGCIVFAIECLTGYLRR
jgi:hypothetical protein